MRSKTTPSTARPLTLRTRRSASAAAVARAKSKRGFASMTRLEVARIAALGGKAVSSDAQHMRAIGALGRARRVSARALKRKGAKQ